MSYNHLTKFPEEDRAFFEAAKQATGLSTNQIIVRAVHERGPGIVAEHQSAAPVDLSPIPEASVAEFYQRMTGEDKAADRKLGQASLRAQKGGK